MVCFFSVSTEPQMSPGFNLTYCETWYLYVILPKTWFNGNSRWRTPLFWISPDVEMRVSYCVEWHPTSSHLRTMVNVSATVSEIPVCLNRYGCGNSCLMGTCIRKCLTVHGPLFVRQISWRYNLPLRNYSDFNLFTLFGSKMAIHDIWMGFGVLTRLVGNSLKGTSKDSPLRCYRHSASFEPSHRKGMWPLEMFQK